MRYRANPYECCCGQMVECIPCDGTGSIRSRICLRCEGDGVCEAVCYEHGEPRRNPAPKGPPPIRTSHEYRAPRAGGLQGVVAARPLSRDDIRLPKKRSGSFSEPVITKRTFGPTSTRTRGPLGSFIILPGGYAAPTLAAIEGAHRFATIDAVNTTLKRLPDGEYTIIKEYDGAIIEVYSVTKSGRKLSRWAKV